MHGKRSPWGKIDSCEQLADGIWSVGTPSHGGIKLDRVRNAAVPTAARREGGWYEEDCEWSLVALVFPECFPKHSVYAHATAKQYYPDEYTIITGKPVALEESWVLQQRAKKAS